MATIGELATLITARTEPFTRGLKDASRQAKTFSSTITSTLGGSLRRIGSMMTSTAGMIAGIGGAFTVGGIISKSIKLAVAAEDTRTAYATFLKDLGKADKLLAQLQKYSAATPFQASEIKEAGKQLLAFGFAENQIMTMIRTIGDLAAGSQKPMADFVDILGKVKASGVASMADVNRLADRGVPIFQELANVMGVASSEVRSLVGTGKVGFADIYAAISRVVSETGLFGGAVAKMAETTSGKLSTLKDNIDSVMRDIGSAILEGINVKELITSLTDLTKRYKQDIVDSTVAGVRVLTSFLESIGPAINFLKMVYHRFGMAKEGILSANAEMGEMMSQSVLGRAIWGDLTQWSEREQRRSRARWSEHAAAYNTARDRMYQGEWERRGLISRPMQRTQHEAKTEQLQEKSNMTLQGIWQQQDRLNSNMERFYNQQLQQYGRIIEVF